MATKEEIHGKVIQTINRIINGRYKSKRPKQLDFIVGDNSDLMDELDSDDRRIIVKGCYNFSDELSLTVKGGGVIDRERTKDDVKPAEFYCFKEYEMVVLMVTDRADYFSAVEQFVFPLLVRFKRGKAIITRDKKGFGNGYESMLGQIRSLRHVHVLEDFVRDNMQEVLEDAELILRRKVRELGLNGYEPKYEKICRDFSGERDDLFRYAPIAWVQSNDNETGIGFEIQYSPGWKTKNVDSFYKWLVILPLDMYEGIYGAKAQVKRQNESERRKNIQRVYKAALMLYSKRFDTLELAGDDTAYSFMDKNHYQKQDKGIIFSLENEKEFLLCFERWQNAIRYLKYGRAKELSEPLKQLGPGIFENNKLERSDKL